MLDVSFKTRQKFLILAAFGRAGKPLHIFKGMEVMENVGREYFDDENAAYKGTHLEGAIDDLIYAQCLNLSKDGFRVTPTGQDVLSRMQERYFPDVRLG